MICLYCGETIPDESIFCTKCGRQLVVQTAAPAEEIPAAAEPEAAEVFSAVAEPTVTGAFPAAVEPAAAEVFSATEAVPPAEILPEVETGEEEIPATMIVSEEEETLPAEILPEEEIPPAEILPEVEEFPPAEPTGPQCPFCGAALREQAVFCTNCGRRVPVPEKAPEAIPFVGMSQELPKAAILTGISAEKAAPAVILPEAETGEEVFPATMIIPEEEETLPAEMIPEEEVPPAVILPEVE
ncbi:MAG: zinc ribbon domain-containing protein, partial [Lachnospiraceae bacterium]|nr:zinc ribbon domain-containing protein [Lachnospiraceae bacterium]